MVLLYTDCLLELRKILENFKDAQDRQIWVQDWLDKYGAILDQIISECTCMCKDDVYEETIYRIVRKDISIVPLFLKVDPLFGTKRDYFDTSLLWNVHSTDDYIKLLDMGVQYIGDGNSLDVLPKLVERLIQGDDTHLDIIIKMYKSTFCTQNVLEAAKVIF